MSGQTFFVTGGALQADAGSYVPRGADSELLEALGRGEFCYVLTSRQMGKSSLMIRTAVALRDQGSVLCYAGTSAERAQETLRSRPRATSRPGA